MPNATKQETLDDYVFSHKGMRRRTRPNMTYWGSMRLALQAMTAKPMSSAEIAALIQNDHKRGIEICKALIVLQLVTTQSIKRELPPLPDNKKRQQKTLTVTHYQAAAPDVIERLDKLIEEHRATNPRLKAQSNEQP